MSKPKRLRTDVKARVMIASARILVGNLLSDILFSTDTESFSKTL